MLMGTLSLRKEGRNHTGSHRERAAVITAGPRQQQADHEGRGATGFRPDDQPEVEVF